MTSSRTAIRTVLLIDDDVDDFLLFQDAVAQVDPTIEVSHLSGVKDLPAEGACTVPDLLFLDINMPDRNGFEWLQAIREKGCAVPIVMYSTASNPAYVQKAYAEGATVYFPKPESYHTLKKSLEQLLSLDWREPCSVTEHLCRDGQYRVFSPAS